MAKMKGIVPVGDCKVQVREFEIPEPKDDEVLVEVKCSGICGSDVNTFRMSWEQINERQNLVVSHEAGGVVQKVGKNVENISVGDRVCIYHYLGCGKCKYCLEGKYGWCEDKEAYGWHFNGSAREYLIAKAVNCCPLPEELPFEDAAFMACSAGTAYASLKKLDSFAADGYLTVMGLGPIGMVCSLMAAAKGWNVLACDLSETRVKFAEGLGIHVIQSNGDSPLSEQIKDAMDGRLPIRIMDTTGHPSGLADAVEIAENGAHIVTIGKGRRKYLMSDRFDISEVVVKELVIQGSWVFTLPEYYEMMEFMVEHKLSFNNLVTGRYSFDEAQEAFEAVADMNNAGKTVFIKK